MADRGRFGNLGGLSVCLQSRHLLKPIFTVGCEITGQAAGEYGVACGPPQPFKNAGSFNWFGRYALTRSHR